MMRHCRHYRAAPPQRCELRIARSALALAFTVAAGCAALAKVHSFLAPPASSARRFYTQTGCKPLSSGNHRSKLVAAAAGDAAAASDASAESGQHAGPARPDPPSSEMEMTKQAADAAMLAYRDGITRQSVKIRLDTVYSDEDNYIGGIWSKLKGGLPLAESFTRSLWGGEMLKGVRTQAIDKETATMIYRQASDELYDSCVFFMTGRTLVSSEKLRLYFDAMNDRLVVLLNSDDATDPFKVQFQGKDWTIGEDADIGRDVAELFKEITYYFTPQNVNNWQLIEYRAYPHPWEVWLENLDYQMVKLGDFRYKPTYDDLFDATKRYEVANGISAAAKMGKAMKDQTSDFDPFVATQSRNVQKR